LLLISSALEFRVKEINMINLIIDAAKDKFFFKIIADDKSYTSEYINSRENFDKFVVLLFKFLEKNRINIKEVNNIFINQGPGKFSSIRTSLSVAKGLSVSNQLNLYGFNSNQVNDQNYNEIIDLFNKGLLRKNLIKPQYSS
jgi:tRNA A37 threonylcarbamoyladenosine modification protein TsaB